MIVLNWDPLNFSSFLLSFSFSGASEKMTEKAKERSEPFLFLFLQFGHKKSGFGRLQKRREKKKPCGVNEFIFRPSPKMEEKGFIGSSPESQLQFQQSPELS
jgi:hypothetical protein